MRRIRLSIYASKEGHVEIVEMLLNNGADVNAQDSVRRTALFWASLRGHAEIVAMLLAAGAGDDMNAQDDDG